jgi:hypothetical protein
MICEGWRVVILGQDELRRQAVCETIELRNVADRRVSWFGCRGLLMVSKDIPNALCHIFGHGDRDSWHTDIV